MKAKSAAEAPVQGGLLLPQPGAPPSKAGPDGQQPPALQSQAKAMTQKMPPPSSPVALSKAGLPSSGQLPAKAGLVGGTMGPGQGGSWSVGSMPLPAQKAAPMALPSAAAVPGFKAPPAS